MYSRQQMWDMPIGGQDNSNGITHWCGNFLYAVLGGSFKIAFRYNTIGLEKLRAMQGKSGVLLVGNHSSYLDVFFTWFTVRPRQWVRFMARENLFDAVGGLFGQAITRVGAFPIARDSADRTALKRAARMLKNKEVVGIFPEGTRRGKGSKEMKLHAGAALIARMGKAPMMPFCVHNVDSIKRKGERIRFPKVTVEFGDPVYIESFDFIDKQDRLEAATWYVMRECFAMKQHKKPQEVDMVELFPDCKDYSSLFLEHPIAAAKAQD